MENEIQKSVVATIIDDIIRHLPQELMQTYNSPPGRKPSKQVIQISQSISKLKADEAEQIIRDVADYTTFSILYLIDANFKEANLTTRFLKLQEDPEPTRTDLVSLYRSKVDPGGQISLS